VIYGREKVKFLEVQKEKQIRKNAELRSEGKNNQLIKLQNKEHFYYSDFPESV
jgi:hypothetical protein